MNKGIPLTIALCCVWPLVVHLLLTYIPRELRRRDWSNIQWSEIHWPWRKEK